MFEHEIETIFLSIGLSNRFVSQSLELQQHIYLDR